MLTTTMPEREYRAMAKRDLQVSVKISKEDLALLRKACDRLWPGAPVTNSTLLLVLAKQRAEEILEKHPRSKWSAISSQRRNQE